jgi:hypothetical protein
MIIYTLVYIVPCVSHLDFGYVCLMIIYTFCMDAAILCGVFSYTICAMKVYKGRQL